MVVYGLETVSAGLPDDAYKVYESVKSFEETVQAFACDHAARMIGKPLGGRIDRDMPRKDVDLVASAEKFADHGFTHETCAAGNGNEDEKLLSDSTKLQEL